MRTTLKRAAFAATFALTVGSGQSQASPLPVMTAQAIGGAPPTEQVWGGGAFAAGLIFGGVLGAAVAAPYFAHPAYAYAYPIGYPVYYRPYAYYRPLYRGYTYRPAFYGYRAVYARPYWGYRRAYFRPYYARPYRAVYRARHW